MDSNGVEHERRLLGSWKSVTSFWSRLLRPQGAKETECRDGASRATVPRHWASTEYIPTTYSVFPSSTRFAPLFPSIYWCGKHRNNA